MGFVESLTESCELRVYGWSGHVRVDSYTEPRRRGALVLLGGMPPSLRASV